MRSFSHLDYSKRQQIERMLKNKHSVKEIASCIDVSLNTVYLEIKRGSYNHMNSDLTRTIKYSADLGQYKYRNNLLKKGRTPAVLKDDKLNKYIKYLIKNKKYSPEAITHMIKHDKISFDINIKSKNTIYAAIRKGHIKGLKISDLPRGGYKKRAYLNDKGHKRKVFGTSIELRNPDILNRNQFGHWEMDCVVGKQTNKTTLLVLTERKTRHEIIEKMRSHTTYEVVKALNRIEKRYKSSFYKIFKTMTVDNGKEFSDSKGMEKALYRVGNRTKIYYCHPRSPEERGSNENANILIRRFLPKGTDFDKTVSRPLVKQIEDWINTYPRGIFDGKTSEYLFNLELENLGISSFP